ncbi:hypothetical protein [Longispora albida]|uniref:hypothetical protein n=1 Tax=Longispora albida TaxID=203523 RepID=UPI0003A855A1|nr:hypothetical protein [Longispora albida]
MSAHRWVWRGRYNAHCQMCGTWAQRRPSPYERRWFTEWRLPDGTWRDNYNGEPAPSCTRGGTS